MSAESRKPKALASERSKRFPKALSLRKARACVVGAFLLIHMNEQQSFKLYIFDQTRLALLS